MRVLDKDLEEDERIQAVETRAEQLEGETSIAQFFEREKLSTEVKKDPGYKFLMMVAAYSSRRIGKLISTGQTKKNTGKFLPDPGHVCETVCEKPDDSANEWIQAPEVIGVVHLSATVYGHIKEAESIVNSGYSCKSLKILIENSKFSSNFARLVSIRMALSSCLSSTGYRLDKTFQRLHQEQHMVLKAIRCSDRRIKGYDWTRPVGSTVGLGMY
jgi:hypothetical protein